MLSQAALFDATAMRVDAVVVTRTALQASLTLSAFGHVTNLTLEKSDFLRSSP